MSYNPSGARPEEVAQHNAQQAALAVLAKYMIGSSAYYVDKANWAIRKLEVRGITLVIGSNGNIGATYQCADARMPGKTPQTFEDGPFLFSTLEDAMVLAWGTQRHC